MKIRNTAVLLGLLLMAAGLMGFGAAGVGIVGYWKLDETSGTTAADVTGANNATYGAAPANPTPSIDIPAALPAGGHSLSFDGSDDALNVASLSGLPTGNTPHSIAAWIKVTALPSNRAWILLLGNEGTGSHHWLINAAGVTQFGSWGGAPQVAPVLPVGQWRHVAITFDGTTLTGYVGGTSIGTGTGTFNLQGIPLTMGTSHIGENFFNGLLDDVRIYNRALTPGEITSLAAGTSGPPAPLGLVATPNNTQVSLNWTSGPSGTVYNVKRSTVMGGSPPGTYLTIASDVATNNYIDAGPLTYGQTYYYVVSAVTFGEGPNSNEVSARIGEVTALPNTGLQTTGTGGTATFDVTFHVAAPAVTGSTVTVTSNNPVSGGLVSSPTNPTPAPSITINVAPGFTGPIPITVTGVDDFVVTGNVLYTVSVSASGFPGLAIPDIMLTNLERDSVGILVSKSSVVTTTAGGQDAFTVQLNSKPVPNTVVSIAVTSSDSTEATVSPSPLQFSEANWNAPQQVTVTGVGVNLTYLNANFTVNLAVQAVPMADPGYAGLIRQVVGINLHLETPPALPRVWGGSGGGCGLLGLEIGLPLLLLGLLRKRRK